MLKTTGTKLETVRKANGMTQQEVADELGISRNTLAGYESGKSKIPLSVFIRLAELYEVDVFTVCGVNAPDIEFDISENEYLKAHAKYKIKAEWRKDCAYKENYLPEQYYFDRYCFYMNMLMKYYKIFDKTDRGDLKC